MKRKIILQALFLLIFSNVLGQRNVRVLSYKIDTIINNECYKWNYPNKDTMQVIISKMTSLSGEEHHGCYNNYSCDIKGEIIYAGIKYSYSLNAGGWVRLVSLDYSRQFLLACTDKKYFKYFISTKDCNGVSGGK
jgi:hypothetical protein